MYWDKREVFKTNSPRLLKIIARNNSDFPTFVSRLQIMAIQIKTILYVILSLALVPSVSRAQHHSGGEKKPFVLAVTDEIKSAKLGETRVLNIYLPQGYSPDSAATYPVIYLLDGSADEDFVHITGIVQFLSMIVDTTVSYTHLTLPTKRIV